MERSRERCLGSEGCQINPNYDIENNLQLFANIELVRAILLHFDMTGLGV